MKNQKKLFLILLWASLAGILLVMSITGAARELDLSGPFWAYAAATVGFLSGLLLIVSGIRLAFGHLLSKSRERDLIFCLPELVLLGLTLMALAVVMFVKGQL